MNINSIIAEFDNISKKGFNEHEFSTQLKTIDLEEGSGEWLIQKAETMAFDFMESESKDESEWGTFFRPMFVFNNEDGTVSEYPSIKLIDSKMIEYWEKRANVSTNPILVARYSALLWDFKELVTGEKPSHTHYINYVEANIKIAEGNYYKHKVYTFRKLVSALNLSIKINNKQLIEKCKNALLKYEELNAEDKLVGMWGYSFDNLICNNRVSLSSNEKESIINDLELRLNRLTDVSNEENLEPFAAEKIVVRLVEYYQRNNENDKIKQAVLMLELALEAFMINSSPLQKSLWYKTLFNLYKRYNLNDKAKEILKRIRDNEKSIITELKPISVETTISNDEKSEYLESMVEGEITTILQRIAFRFIPDNKEAKEQVLSHSKDFIYLHFPLQIHDEKGRIISLIGSVENDLEGRIVKNISDGMFISSIFLTWVIEEAINKKKLTVEDVMNLISESPAFEHDRLEILKSGIESYFIGNYISSIHILIPQFEEAIRHLLELSGEYIMKPTAEGNYDFRTLGSLLSSGILNEILGEEIINYFKILYIDKKGWNLRNNICHGIISSNFMTRREADRVFHTILILGQVKPINKTNTPTNP